MENFEILLRKHDLRVTKPRRRIFNAMLHASRPLSHAEIYAQCGEVDRASVYRTIDSFIDIGAVKVIYIGWKKLYELTDLFSPHHHHLQCVKCNTIVHLSDAGFEKTIEDLANKQGYTLVSHHFEIEGICPTCQQSVQHE